MFLGAVMPSPQLFSALSPARQLLLRLCQRLNYGHIRGLVIHGREPLLTHPSTVLVCEVKLDSSERARPEAYLNDFALCAEAVRLLSRLDEIRDGTISRLEVRAGIPRMLILEESVAIAVERRSPS